VVFKIFDHAGREIARDYWALRFAGNVGVTLDCSDIAFSLDSGHDSMEVFVVSDIYIDEDAEIIGFAVDEVQIGDVGLLYKDALAFVTNADDALARNRLAASGALQTHAFGKTNDGSFCVDLDGVGFAGKLRIDRSNDFARGNFRGPDKLQKLLFIG